MSWPTKSELTPIKFVCKCIETAQPIKGKKQLKFSRVWPKVNQVWRVLITIYTYIYKSRFVCIITKKLIYTGIKRVCLSPLWCLQLIAVRYCKFLHPDFWNHYSFTPKIHTIMYIICTNRLAPGMLWNIGYPSERHLKPQISWNLITYFSITQSLWNFAQSTAMTPLCSVQISKQLP